MATDGVAAVPEAAFGALANETRLDVIRTLGDRSGDGEYVALSFSELQDAVGVETSGKLSYHLDKLTETFLERRDGGYALNVPGVYVYQSLTAAVFSESIVVEPFEVDGYCVECRGRVQFSYREFRVRYNCSNCEADFGSYPLPPGNIADDPRRKIRRAYRVRLILDKVGMGCGVCPYCSGTVDATVHSDNPLGDPFEGRAYTKYVCRNCHWFYFPTFNGRFKYTPVVIDFAFRRGVDVFTEPRWTDECESLDRIVSEDPWRAEVVYWVDGDELWLTVDDDLRILDAVERESAPGGWPELPSWNSAGRDDFDPEARPESDESESGRFRSESPPTVEVGDDVDEAFAVLADETRLRIIETLGDRSDDGAFVALSYADLKDAVGVRDSGKFSYHLRKLTDRFLVQEDDGYKLDVPGIYVYRALSTEAYEESPEIEPFPVDGTCEFCGGRLRMAYREYRGWIECEDCGTTHLRYPLPPAALGDEPTDRLPRALHVRLLLDKLGMHHGVCPYCSGTVDAETGADVGLPAGRANAGDPATVEYVCRNCHWYLDVTVCEPLELHPAVVSFLHQHDVDAFEDPPWTDAYRSFDRTVSEAPWRAEATFVVDDEELRLTVDEDLTVVATDRCERATGELPGSPGVDGV